MSAPAALESGRTLAPFGRRAAPVVANDEVGAYRLVTVDDAHGPSDPRPGQFYMLATRAGWGAGEGERPHLPRALSFASAEDGRLGFLLEAVGPGTARLAAARPGDDELWLVGPLGRGFRPPAAPPVLVGGGIGAAPVLAMAAERDGAAGAGPAAKRDWAAGAAPAALPPPAPVLLGFRSALHARARELVRGPCRVATDDGSVGRRALVTELLREELDARAGHAEVLACGPAPMLEAVRELCAGLGVPAQLALEAGMACGYGACYGCVVPTRRGLVRLCVDGPVLAAGELEGVPEW